jgi:apolipoprotein N-acyltransferase
MNWPRWRLRLAKGLPVAFAGLAAAGGQAPLNLWWLTLAAMAFITARVAMGSDLRDRLWTGWCAGAGYFAGALFWIVEPFMVDAAHDGWMAPFALVLMAGGMALFWMLAAVLGGLGRGPASRAAGFAIGLISADLLRGYVLTGFPWALVGHVWIGTPVGQMAAFVGPIGLSAITMGLGLLLALGRILRRPAVFGLAALTMLAALWGGGGLRLAKTDPPRARPVHVRLVQPDAAQDLKWQPGMWDLFLDRQMKASAAPATYPLDLVIWPETAIPYLLEDAAPILDEAIGASHGVPLALGVQRRDGERFYNSLIATDKTGAVRRVYDKYHLVPFGEYMPFGDFLANFGITAFAARLGNGYSSGKGAAVLDLGRAGKVLPLICYEAVFPQDLFNAPERADWILQITNDAWFGNLAGPYQHLAQARLRAIEQGLPLMRVANTGITAAIDAKGRVIDSLPLNTDGWIDVSVPAALAPTFYARTGDLPATILLILGILALGAARVKRSD